MSPEERDLRRRARDDYPWFASRCLTIRSKSGSLKKLQFNTAQRFLHEKLEAQKKAKGWVRAIILKGRKQGCSTYVTGRHYHETIHRFGCRAYILTHKQEATDNLFEMIERYHAKNNPLLKPLTGASNAKEMNFKLLDSGYKVGTAGSADVGRSDTIQLFHWSEVGFCANAADHAKGVLQAVPLEKGTEIILESTANGLGNYYANQWSLAVQGLSEFQAIFIPWFWQEEYRLTPEPDFTATKEEAEYAKVYGLDDGQIAWMRSKMIELGRPEAFHQEFPATPDIAFQSSGEDRFIKPIKVSAARQNKVTPGDFVPLVIGIDPARGGSDKTAVLDRQGRRAGGKVCEVFNEPDSMALTGKIVRLIREHKPRKIIIDATDGTGQSIYDRLTELGYGPLVEPVKFSQGATESDRYLNKRAEMWDELRQWLENPVGVQIPDDDKLQEQLCAPVWGKGATRHNSNAQLVLEDKDHIRQRIGVSPDLADALALTFAVPMAASIPAPIVVSTGAADPVVGY